MIIYGKKRAGCEICNCSFIMWFLSFYYKRSDKIDFLNNHVSGRPKYFAVHLSLKYAIDNLYLFSKLPSLGCSNVPEFIA